MKAYPLQMGITPQGTIILAQTDEEDGRENVITLSPGQVEMLVFSLRTAAEALQDLERSASNMPSPPAT